MGYLFPNPPCVSCSDVPDFVRPCEGDGCEEPLCEICHDDGYGLCPECDRDRDLRIRKCQKALEEHVRQRVGQAALAGHGTHIFIAADDPGLLGIIEEWGLNPEDVEL